MYFVSDIKKLSSSTIIRVVLGAMLIIAIVDPISVYWQASAYPDFFIQIGEHPYQYWLLINSAGWGNQVYNTLFWTFPVLLTGMVYYTEHNTSVQKFLVVRGSIHKYLRAKILSTFIFTFVSFGVILLINLAVTYLVFPNNAELTLQYQYIIPSNGSFAAIIYYLSPALLAMLYSLLNALTIAVFSVITLSFHMVFSFKNKYIAIACPVIIYYAITFIFDSIPDLLTHNIRIIIQPLAASGLTRIITFEDLFITISCWFLVAIGTSVLGFVKNKDIL